MSADRGFDPTPEASRSYLPPVFTQWSRPEPRTPTPEPMGAEEVDAGHGIAAQRVETTAAPTAPSPDPVDEPDTFPVDAFFIPEESERLPTGLVAAETTGNEPRDVALDSLVLRLEEIASVLRADGRAALGRLAAGDRLDAMVAGLVAGYLAALDE